jgi:hypothetical protein
MRQKILASVLNQKFVEEATPRLLSTRNAGGAVGGVRAFDPGLVRPGLTICAGPTGLKSPGTEPRKR